MLPMISRDGYLRPSRSDPTGPRPPRPSYRALGGPPHLSVDSSQWSNITPLHIGVCKRCGKRFTGPYAPSNLKRHERSVHGPRLKCVVPQCNESFSRVDNLHAHTRKHHRELSTEHISTSMRPAAQFRSSSTEYSPRRDSDVLKNLGPTLHIAKVSNDTLAKERDTLSGADKIEKQKESKVQVRTIGACWLCQTKKKQCSPQTPCSQCEKAWEPTQTRSRLWKQVGCYRGNLLDLADDMMPCTSPVPCLKEFQNCEGLQASPPGGPLLFPGHGSELLSDPAAVIRAMRLSVASPIHGYILEKSYAIALRHCHQAAKTAQPAVNALPCIESIFNVCGFTASLVGDPRQEMGRYLKSLNRCIRSLASDKAKSREDWFQAFWSLFILNLILCAATNLFNYERERLQRGYNIAISLFILCSGPFDPVREIFDNEEDLGCSQAELDLKELRSLLQESRNGGILSAEDILSGLLHSGAVCNSVESENTVGGTTAASFEKPLLLSPQFTKIRRYSENDRDFLAIPFDPTGPELEGPLRAATTDCNNAYIAVQQSSDEPWFSTSLSQSPTLDAAIIPDWPATDLIERMDFAYFGEYGLGGEPQPITEKQEPTKKQVHGADTSVEQSNTIPPSVILADPLVEEAIDRWLKNNPGDFPTNANIAFFAELGKPQLSHKLIQEAFKRKLWPGYEEFSTTNLTGNSQLGFNSSLTQLQSSRNWDKPRDPERVYSCTRMCGKTFSKKGEWVRHETMHEPQSIWECPSEGCGRTFSRKDKMRDHLKLKHKVEPDAKILELNRKDTNSTPPRHCGFCGVVHNSWDEWFNHVGQHFEGKIGEACDMRHWSEEYALQDPQNGHSYPEPGPSDIKFTEIYDRGRAVIDLTQGSTTRPHTPVASATQSTHMLKPTRLRPGASSKHPDAVTHKVGCDSCGLKFSGDIANAKTNLRRHMRSVHQQGMITLDCPRCDVTFNRRDNLKAHIRKYHPEFDVPTRS